MGNYLTAPAPPPSVPASTIGVQTLTDLSATISLRSEPAPASGAPAPTAEAPSAVPSVAPPASEIAAATIAVSSPTASAFGLTHEQLLEGLPNNVAMFTFLQLEAYMALGVLLDRFAEASRLQKRAEKGDYCRQVFDLLLGDCAFVLRSFPRLRAVVLERVKAVIGECRLPEDEPLRESAQKLFESLRSTR